MDRCDGCDALTGVPRYVDGRTLCSVCAEGNPRRDTWRDRIDISVGLVWLFIGLPLIIVIVAITLSGG